MYGKNDELWAVKTGAMKVHAGASFRERNLFTKEM